MKSLDDLTQKLARIDGRGYKAYKEIAGAYQGEWFTLYVDHVQGDPFAAPTRIRARVNHNISHLPAALWTTRIRCVALRDFLARTVHRAIQTLPQRSRGIGKSGLISIDVGGQEILERSAVVITEQWVEARLEIGLPASGRTILGKHADAMFCLEIPPIIQQSLLWAQVPRQLCQGHVDYAENYDSIQRALSARGLVAFIADGSILPRKSGNATQPLSVEHARPWVSPDSLHVTFDLPHPVKSKSDSMTSVIRGSGISRGITLIVGGGYHGKSTLLQAIQNGVYPHVPGDGREYVVTSSDAVKVRAEDGRRIGNFDISGFMSHLPQHLETSCFSTDNASGSTSQAASILEALEIGSRVILLDEDTSATNFLVRDARMQALVKKSDEPITPFLDRVQELYVDFEVSTVLVLGGCGDYFDVADTVICMKEFHPVDVTDDAKEIARTHQTARRMEISDFFPPVCTRILHAEDLDASYGRKDVKITVRVVDEIVYGGEIIRLEAVEQLVDESQTRAVGYALYLIKQRFMHARTPIREIVSALQSVFDQEGLDVLNPFCQSEAHPGNFSRPRVQEIVAALNRLRTTRFE